MCCRGRDSDGLSNRVGGTSLRPSQRERVNLQGVGAVFSLSSKGPSLIVKILPWKKEFYQGVIKNGGEYLNDVFTSVPLLGCRGFQRALRLLFLLHGRTCQCGKREYILGNRRRWKNKNVSVKCLILHPRVLIYPKFEAVSIC